jgi:outer membrane protein assembly factor BamB
VWRRRIFHAIGGVDDATLAYAQGRVVGEAMEGSPSWPLVSPDHAEILFALNAANGQVLWTRRLATGYEPRYKQAATPMVRDGVVYAGNAINGTVVAVKLTDGRRLWQVQFPDPVTRPLAFVNHRLVGITSHGRIFSMNPNGTGIASTRLGPFVNVFGPVVINRTLFVAENTRHQGFLQAVPWRTAMPAVRPAGMEGT